MFCKIERARNSQFSLNFFCKVYLCKSLKTFEQSNLRSQRKFKVATVFFDCVFIAFYLRHIYLTFTYQNRLMEVVIVLNFAYNPTGNFQSFRALSLVVSNLRSKTKRFQFESGCQLCTEVSSLVQ